MPHHHYLLMLLLAACRVPGAPPPAAPEPPRLSSEGPLPAPDDLLGGCPDEEGARLVAYLGLLPPWEDERPEEMLRLATLLTRRETEPCLRAARALYAELAQAYPNEEEAPTALLRLGLLMLRLGEAVPPFEAILSAYPDRDAALLAAATLTNPEEALAFLRAFGGERGPALVASYLQRLRRGSDQPEPSSLPGGRLKAPR